jgi:hypothetical protein
MSNPGTVRLLENPLALVVKTETGLPETEKDFSLGGCNSLWLARKRTTSLFSFLMGTMSSRQVKGEPELKIFVDKLLLKYHDHLFRDLPSPTLYQAWVRSLNDDTFLRRYDKIQFENLVLPIFYENGYSKQCIV